MHKNIVSHIDKNFQKHSKSQLKDSLLGLGFKEKDIDKAIETVEKDKRHYEIFGPHHAKGKVTKEEIKSGDEHLFLILGVIFSLCFFAVTVAVLAILF